MIVSRTWINEFVDLSGITNEEIAEKLTRASCEVEEIEVKNMALPFAIIAKVTAIEPHPTAKKLQIVTVDLGKDSIQIVCGAQNFQVGNFVPYVPVGTTFDDGLVLSNKEIAGVMSAGMLCSAKELGISTDHSGLFILDDLISDPHTEAVGTSFAEYFQVNSDVLFHIDNKSITNRNDLWGILGVAREIAAIFGRPFQNPYKESWQATQLSRLPRESLEEFEATIATDLVRSYALLQMDGVDGAKMSPLWMQYRLHLLGVRAINALVDISNYVMLELGLPNHIYDRTKLTGRMLHVHALEHPTTFVTLDGQERALIAGDLVIRDKENVQIIAGIMGGQQSMVNEHSSSIIMEAAVWDAMKVRQTALRLALRTDSSARYEKSLDAHMVSMTLLRMARLVQELFPQSRITSPIFYAKEAVNNSDPILISPQWVERRLGVSIEPSEVIELLERLAFTCESVADGVFVTAPTFRATKGKMIAEDILEEIARIYGYDHLKAQAPLWPVKPNKLPDFINLERHIQDFMVLHAQAYEVFTHPLVGVDLLRRAHWHDENEALRMLNSTNVEHDRLRSSLIPSLLKALSNNSKHFEAFRMFELGRIQVPDQELFSREYKQLAILFYDSGESPFMSLLNTTEALVRYIGRKPMMRLKVESSIVPSDWIGIHPYEQAMIEIDGVACGSLFGIHPSLMKEYKVKGHASIAILDVTRLSMQSIERVFDYNGVSRFPMSRFDSTWMLDASQLAGDLMQHLMTIDIDILKDVYIFDIYLPEGIQERHITIRAMFGSNERTLDAVEIKQAEESLMQSLTAKGYRLKQ
ncbi:phenylalanine--tRNA ligase subunit beta [Entomospira entomophila]|uniref:Phenylalanine--tRNA ligase beta subunit n=1 Tax=Entomospira entomophila TaxID=2719988 RepID=A0A968G7J8_9SPIO|nr:phenylalanine--tRNA ligase subunit beta [Entomospira entomophilus]NIZ40055.1 phenylalanine--tRNA ligase subunit beta [Entomospira entomophilus]WDI35616.1 phenylalanine--tRNA ligase subunit beta [Entomospira entomophilus]